jgi:hypothetical protein
MSYVGLQNGEQYDGEEAHYWWTVAEFTDLSLEHGLDKMLADVIQYRARYNETFQKEKKEVEGAAF